MNRRRPRFDPEDLAGLCALYELQLAAERDRVWRWRLACFFSLFLALAPL